MIIGAAGLIMFTLYEKHVATDPIVPMSIFGSQTAVVSYVGTLVHGLMLWCSLYYLPLYFEAVANTDDYGMTNQHHYISLSVDRIAEY
jgi:hypothetical protein